MPSVEVAPKQKIIVDETISKDSIDNLTRIPESVMDLTTFEQILEMDDDEEREFSRAIVFGFFEQAEETFNKMEASVEAKDLPQLSSLGHFLKGSSATLGLTEVKDSCEKIQHLGVKKDENGAHDITDESLCLDKIKKTLDVMKKDYHQARVHLARFYGEGEEGLP